MSDIFVPKTHVANGVLPVNIPAVISYHDASTYPVSGTVSESDSYTHLLADLAQLAPQIKEQNILFSSGKKPKTLPDDYPPQPPR